MGRRPHRGERCDAARLLLSAVLDGEASELERAQTQRHLAECPDCRAFAAQARALAGVLRSTPELAPSRSLAPLAPARRRRMPRAGAVAASLVAVGAAAVLGAFVSARIEQAPVRPSAPELRIANLDTRQAQRVFAQRQVQALLHLPQSDPTIDRSLQLQRLG